MKVIRDSDTFPSELQNSIVTIGNFDGIHLGHKKIFRQLVEEARAHHRKTVVITFDPHPQKVLHPERRPFFLLTPLDEKLHLIEECGIDAVLLVTFTIEFAATTAEQFVQRILWDKLRLSKLYVGYDYAFGKGKKGNAEFLRAAGRNLGFEVDELGVVKEEDLIVSSTNIRLSICDGDVRLARNLLGRPYNIYGTVVRGYQRGTDIGVPTANIVSEKVIPANGVYAVIADVEGRRHQGVINVGHNPTLGENKLSIEVHLFDFQDNIYDNNVEIFFIDRLRSEQKFESAEHLVEQIKKDIDQARTILKDYT